MANSLSARKRARQAERNRRHNASQRSHVRTAIKSVLRAIEKGDKAAAEAAAVVGFEVDVDLVASMIDRPPMGVEDDLGRLCANGVLVCRGTGARQRFRYRHALVRDAVQASLPSERRRELHLAAARASLRSGADEVEPARLARHWTEAGEMLAAARAWLDAAQRVVMLSPAEAIGHAERGLDLVGPDPAGDLASVVSDLQRVIARARGDD